MIIVAGEALYDVFERATHEGDTQVTLDAVTGGSPFNVACGLGRLGYGPAFFGGIARGSLGDRQVSILRQAGVSLDAVVRSDTLTPLMVIDLAEDGQPRYNYYGQSTADLQITADHLAQLRSTPSVLHLGSYSLVMPPIADTLAALVEELPDQAILAIDPNVRAMIEPDRAVWEERLKPLFTRANIIKLSDEDAAFLAPEQSPTGYAASLHDLNGAPVFLTQGAEGVSVFAAGGTQHVSAPKTTVIDTVGAGDAFQTVLIAWASAESRRRALAGRTIALQDCVDIAETAAAVAAVICGQQGPVMPSAEALDAAISSRLFERIGRI
ncbi:MAG: carbohydrate kinase [Pseudomonadota bacterium]